MRIERLRAVNYIVNSQHVVVHDAIENVEQTGPDEETPDHPNSRIQLRGLIERPPHHPCADQHDADHSQREQAIPVDVRLQAVERRRRNPTREEVVVLENHVENHHVEECAEPEAERPAPEEKPTLAVGAGTHGSSWTATAKISVAENRGVVVVKVTSGKF